VNAKNFCYPACTLEFNGKQCNRKVTKSSDGTWYCDRCTLSLPKCEYRYLLMCQLQDHTGTTYATAFQEAGTKIIGYSAEDFFILRDKDEAKWEEVMLGVCWQEYLFKLSIKEQIFYGEPRIGCSIVHAEKLSASATNHHFLE
jgi:replication factor A1